MLAACGGESGTNAKEKDPSAETAGDVGTLDDLPDCDSKLDGDRYYVEEEDANYLCEDKDWVKVDDDKSSSSKKSSSSSSKKGDSGESSSSVKDGPDEEEDPLGECTKDRQDEILLNTKDKKYYYCDNEKWRTASALEYNTYQWEDGEPGEIRSGNVVESNLYVYDGRWRGANAMEHHLKKGCVYETEGDTTTYNDVEFVCSNNAWISNITYGTMTDERDDRTYKTVVIGSQTWMAENLNYKYESIRFSPFESGSYGDDSTSWCIKAGCETYGRLYTWSTVMDSAGYVDEANKVKNSGSGTGCGFGVTCTPNKVHRGICPKGWHVPTSDEYSTLYETVGGIDKAGNKLKASTSWKTNLPTYGMNLYGLSVKPGGYRYYSYVGGINDLEEGAYLWSIDSAENDSLASNQEFRYYDAKAFQNHSDKRYGFSIRCLKDSD